MDKIQLALAANERYFPGLAVALCSALMHLRAEVPVEVIVLDGGLENQSKQQLTDLVREIRADTILSIVVPDMSVFQGMPADYGKSTMAYARLLLPAMLPESKKLIYIDSDMIILRDLSEIWPCAGECSIAAAGDYFYDTISEDCAEPVLQGLVSDVPYFNSGLMVMNLELWRENRLVERCLGYLQEHPEWCNWWDQSALNVVLAGEWERIGTEWNTFTRAMKSYSLENNYHYLTPTKPWLNHEESKSTQPFYEYVLRLGVDIRGNSEYRKSLRLGLSAPVQCLRYALVCLFWGIQLKRKPYRKGLRMLRYWRAYLYFRWISSDRQKMIRAVTLDFEEHFSSRA